MWYVYILEGKKENWYYVGSTNDMVRRLNEHNNGKVQSTKAYTPFKVVFQKEYSSEKEAREYERKLKRSRIEKESIVRNYCRIV